MFCFLWKLFILTTEEMIGFSLKLLIFNKISVFLPSFKKFLQWRRSNVLKLMNTANFASNSFKLFLQSRCNVSILIKTANFSSSSAEILGFPSKLLIFNKKPVCLLSLNLFFYKITCFSLFSSGFCKGVGLMSWLSWKLLVSTLLVRKSLDCLQNC